MECIAKNYHITGYRYKKTTAFFNFSKCYHNFSWLFQKTLVTQWLSFDQVYDREGPRVRRKII
uniref:Uncharacterized protein n=1 Tax=Aegilops tauschii subsp. strangulata TaxID=200361 RepID=A0A453QB18_AEGTS